MYHTRRAVEDAIFGAGRDGHVGAIHRSIQRLGLVKRQRAGDPDVMDVDLVSRRKQGRRRSTAPKPAATACSTEPKGPRPRPSTDARLPSVDLERQPRGKDYT